MTESESDVLAMVRDGLQSMISPRHILRSHGRPIQVSPSELEADALMRVHSLKRSLESRKDSWRQERLRQVVLYQAGMPFTDDRAYEITRDAYDDVEGVIEHFFSNVVYERAPIVDHGNYDDDTEPRDYNAQDLDAMIERAAQLIASLKAHSHN